MGYTADLVREALAAEILDDAEVLQEFDDHVWIKVDRDLWREFMGEDE